MFFIRPSRHPLLFLISTVLLVAGLLQWLLFRPVPVPTDYVGTWSSGRTTLEIRPNGVVTYRTGDGTVFHSEGGPVTALDRETLTYRLFLLPRHLRIDTPPRHKYDDVWTMTVQGQELWLMR